MRDDPKIYTGRIVCGGKENIKGSPSKYEGELKGYLLVRYLCMQGENSIHYMRVVNTDVTSYQSTTPEKCLKTAEKDNKNKYLYACLKNRQQFTPFVVSGNSLLGVEAEATLERIAICLTTKWKKLYSRTCG